jgi:hypothetical protein
LGYAELVVFLRRLGVLVQLQLCGLEPDEVQQDSLVSPFPMSAKSMERRFHQYLDLQERQIRGAIIAIAIALERCIRMGCPCCSPA